MRKTLTYLLLLALPLTCMGRPVGFASSRLAAIAEAAGLVLPDGRNGKRDVLAVTCQGKEVPVVVEYASGEVVHIGLDLFGADIRQENVLVCNFVERYMLESLLDGPSLHGEGNSAGRIVTQGDVFAVLQEKPEKRSVQILLDGEGKGGVVFTGDSGEPVFSIRFPAEIQLLSGKKKDELETAFLRSVTAERKIKKREIPRNLKRVERDLYVSENGYYEIESAQNTAFFRKKGLVYLPLCESSKPVESVMTLLTGYSRKKEYAIQAAFHQYGFKTTEKLFPLDCLIDCCLEEGCVPYVGIETDNGKSLVATLFMVNRPLGYSHTFQFTVDTEMLDKAAGTLQARAYLYTPLNFKKS